MSISIKAIFTAMGLALSAPMAMANCIGTNLFEALPLERQKEVEARADAAPFAKGNLWQATKGDQKLTLLGTYHLADDRHAATLAQLAPHWDEAKGLLVEATADEERALKRAMAEKPDLAFITQGPSLMQSLPPELWTDLSQALAARGVPGFMAAKYRPWFAALTLGFAPCAMGSAAEGGLDKQVLIIAEARDLPAIALEPYDTLFTLFEGLTPEEEIQMIKTSLAFEDQAEDAATTLADLYFSGQSRLLWEMTRELSYDYEEMSREEVDLEMAKMEEILMAKRNRAWIPVIEEAAAKGPQIAAFGALHLSGEEGVLNLLAKRGWSITRLF